MPAIIGLVVAPLLGVAGISATATVVGSLTVGALVTTVVEIGLVAGASLLLGKKRQTPSDINNPQPATAQAVTPQSISPRYFAAGRVMVGGILFWKECIDTERAIFGVVLDCGRIDGYDTIICDGESLSVTFGPFQELSSYQNGGVFTRDLGSNVFWPNAGLKYQLLFTYRWDFSKKMFVEQPMGTMPLMAFEYHPATNGGHFSRIIDAYNNDIYTTEGAYTSDRCKGLTCLYYMARGGRVVASRFNVYPKAFPEVSAIIRGALLYDPRTDTRYWNRNSILVLAWYLTHPDGGRLPLSKIVWDEFAAEADYCDRLVAKFGGGTEKWAQTDCQWHTGEPVRDVLARLQAACDATIWEDGEGMIHVWIMKDVTPTVTITDRDISSIQIDEMSGALDEINHLTPSYMEPRENYQTIPGPIVTDDASIAKVGVRAQTITLKEVASFNQAYRLAYRAMKRKNPEMRLQIVGGPSLLRCLGQFVVRVQSDAAQIDATFRFEERIKISPNAERVQLTLAMVGANDYDDVTPPYDPVSPYETNVIVPDPVISIAQPDPPTLAGVTVSGDRFINVTATVSDLPPEDVTLTYYAHYRPVDGSHAPLGDWIICPTVISEWVRQTDIVTVGDEYEVQGWFIQNGAVGPMSASEFIVA